jgi:3-methyladenine DNA glycosylase AlkC
MAEPFKHLLGAREVRAAAEHLARSAGRLHARRARAAFQRSEFEALALTGLESLEFKARAEHIASALEATLPPDFGAACTMLEAALAPAPSPDSEATPPASDEGLAGWIVWPLGEYVARRGLAEPERALAALHALTQRLTAEWALRPFIEAHPTLTFRTLATWTGDPSTHVRRLVSEGSRPRLPWGKRIPALIADPSPTLPLLAALQDDPSAYVRRSVANHLNDIAKDHPHLVADWLAQHLPGASADRRALLRHASRTLIKQGEPRILGAFGLGAALRGDARLTLAPKRITLGGSVELCVELTSRARTAQELVLDYVVHHVKAHGGTSPKVFKGWTRTLAPRATLQLRKRHAVRPISTRRYFSGAHRVELQVNGQVVAEATFELRGAE